MSSPFRRSLPSRPNLEQQRKQAKELLSAFQHGDATAVARVRSELPDKPSISLADGQFVIAREYGFPSWSALKQHVEGQLDERTPEDQAHDAFSRRDAQAVRRLLTQHASLRRLVNAPVFAFNAPPLVICANDAAMVDVLLEFGADPNQRSEWWAGGFHPLHVAEGAAADRLLAAGATVDACAAAHLDRADLLVDMLVDDPTRANERGGDGQTPLHFAKSRMVVDLLLEAGADIDARDVDHRATPAQWMLDRQRGRGRYALAQYLVQRRATVDIFLAAALGLTTSVQTLLSANRALLDERTGQGAYGSQPPSSDHIYVWTIGSHLTPLDVAAQFEQSETLAAMLSFATPLQRLTFAARRGDASAARALVREQPGIVAAMPASEHRALADAAWRGDVKSAALMLELGFDPHTPGHDSGTALHCAAWEGATEIVRLILRHPDMASLIAIKDARYGATPLGWCTHGSLHGNSAHDHAGVARLLLAAGATVGPDAENASPAVRGVIDAWRAGRAGT
ncbi:MAG: hypothetical protein U0132_08865 [Gemmatimonadaceae bacterium]